MVQQHTWYGMLCSNFHIYHRFPKIKDKKNKKIKTIPYLPTHKLKNISETDLFFSRPNQLLSWRAWMIAREIEGKGGKSDGKLGQWGFMINRGDRQ